MLFDELNVPCPTIYINGGFEMSEIELGGIVAALLSLVFSYVPGLNAWFDALKTEYKRLIMLGLLVLVSAVIYGVACAGFAPAIGVTATCDEAGAIELLKILLAAIVANQGVYKITKG